MSSKLLGLFELLNRYLTKATEQIVLMASDEHIEKFVWNSSGADEKDDIEKVVAENDEDGLSDEEGDARRIFSFEVSQSEDVEKRITVRDGFTVCNQLLCICGLSVLTPCSGQASSNQVQSTATYLYQYETRSIRHAPCYR